MSEEPRESFDAMPHDAWAVFHDLARRAYGKETPWPREVVVQHLRWLVGERIIGKLRAEKFPTHEELEAEWNWSPKRVRLLLADVEGWQDPLRRKSWEWLRGDRNGGPRKKKGATGAQEGRNEGATGAQVEQANADNTEGKGATGAQEGRNEGATGAYARDTSARVHLSPSTSPEVVGGALPPAPKPPDPPRPRPAPPPPPATVDVEGRTLPADLPALLSGMSGHRDPVSTLVSANVTSTVELLALTRKGLQFAQTATRGAVGEVVAKAIERHLAETWGVGFSAAEPHPNARGSPGPHAANRPRRATTTDLLDDLAAYDKKEVA